MKEGSYVNEVSVHFCIYFFSIAYSQAALILFFLFRSGSS